MLLHNVSLARTTRHGPKPKTQPEAEQVIKHLNHWPESRQPSKHLSLRLASGKILGACFSWTVVAGPCSQLWSYRQFGSMLNICMLALGSKFKGRLGGNTQRQSCRHHCGCGKNPNIEAVTIWGTNHTNKMLFCNKPPGHCVVAIQSEGKWAPVVH